MCVFLICSSTEKQKKDTASDRNSNNIQQLKVFNKDGRFARWPANNGIWIWENETILGFVKAADREKEGFYTNDEETARNRYESSYDGGEIWTIENAYECGQTRFAYDYSILEDQADKPTNLEQPIDDFTDPVIASTLMRNEYHGGPSRIYYSMNSGEEWIGLYSFPNLGTNGVGTLTVYFVEDPQELSAFINVANEKGREGRIINSRTADRGLNWELVNCTGEEPEGFDIITARLFDNELYTMMRSRELEPRRDFLKSYRSKDNGQTWQEETNPAFETCYGGSPPALVQMEDGRLLLPYIYRSDYGSKVYFRISESEGKMWGNEITVRSGDGATKDVGYSRMVQRPDGNLVILYYWNNALQAGSDPYLYIAASIVDPDIY